MWSILMRAAMFAAGVLAFWLVDFFHGYGVVKAALDGETPSGVSVLCALGFSAYWTTASGMGAFLGMAGARRATLWFPLWSMVPVGILFGLLTAPTLDALVKVRIISGVRGPEVLWLTVATIVAFPCWLVPRSVELVRRYSPEIRREYRRVHSARAEAISLWLALTPWVLGVLQLLGVPGFRGGSPLESLVGTTVLVTPPLSFAVAVVALSRDRFKTCTRTGWVVSFLTFALWLTFLLWGLS